ncbi:hypothetical protein Ddye_027922 [Dipteronia dyeriana]|uniref:Uncharacterized protein n=1 Tax=Dipteronia dyeriana TaxID=168575 RepID=A0AAD9WRW3_9ROSI|nr:hypothetical protein Ddye_027922 [Dipteronia dyeriana]
MSVLAFVYAAHVQIHHSKSKKNQKSKNETGNQVTPLPELIAEPTNARSMLFHEYLAPEIIKEIPKPVKIKHIPNPVPSTAAKATVVSPANPDHNKLIKYAALSTTRLAQTRQTVWAGAGHTKLAMLAPLTIFKSNTGWIRGLSGPDEINRYKQFSLVLILKIVVYRKKILKLCCHELQRSTISVLQGLHWSLICFGRSPEIPKSINQTDFTASIINRRYSCYGCLILNS